jgi:hypothetical protein
MPKQSTKTASSFSRVAVTRHNAVSISFFSGGAVALGIDDIERASDPQTRAFCIIDPADDACLRQRRPEIAKMPALRLAPERETIHGMP